MKFSSFASALVMAAVSLLASACSQPNTIDQAYSNMGSADFAIAGVGRSIFSSHDF